MTSGLVTAIDREAALLAPYAMHSIDTRGRRHAEPSHPYRSCYQRDRDRITHSSAFRRLSHKTQVFTGETGDYHRSRLTHTLEVASIARTLARGLRLNEDLVEALALAHDIGHPPFGHAGEDVLNECLAAHGGFNHNRQALRIFERLEQRYPEFPGLNLSYEVLEGQLDRSRKTRSAGEQSPLLEAQVVDVADSIAYDAHDADDALESGLITLEQLATVPLWHEASRRVRRRWSALDEAGLRRAVVHELIDSAVSATLASTSARLDDHQPDSATEARSLPPLVQVPGDLLAQRRELETFLFERVYRHPHIVAQREACALELRGCYERLTTSGTPLPTPYAEVAHEEGRERAVGDYLSGLTDRALVELWRRGG